MEVVTNSNKLQNENSNLQETVFTYTKQSWLKTIGRYWFFWLKEVNTFFTLLVGFCGLTASLITLVGKKHSITFYLVAIIVAIVVTCNKAFIRYMTFNPETLRDESEKVQRIFRKRKSGWQSDLARQMIIDRITQIDLTLDRVKTGLVFVEPRILPFKEYYNWLCMRPEAMLRLADVTKLQCTKIITEAISKTTSTEHLKTLKDEIVTLVDLYRYAKDFEVQCHQIIPPEGLKQVHQYVYGWTDSIRDAINQFTAILDKISSLKPKEYKDGVYPEPLIF